MNSRGLLLGSIISAAIAACGGAPGPAPEVSPTRTASLPRRSANVADDCAQVPGERPPAPLEREYTGVARNARCQREVYTIMGGLTHFLGVKCDYCHLVPDYRAMTHNKQIANWMAEKLVPSLATNSGDNVWCNDCHVVNGKGTAKILGNPRTERFAIEWMTIHLAGKHKTREGGVLRCKHCHQGNLGTPEFVRKIILSDNVPHTKVESRVEAAEQVSPLPSEAAPSGSNPESVPSSAPEQRQ